MKREAIQVLRNIRTDHLQEHVANAGDLSLHMLLRMFVLALSARHISVVSRRHDYVGFDDLVRDLLNADGTIRTNIPYQQIEAIAREALARLLRLDVPDDPAGEWAWTCSGASHPPYYTAEVKRFLHDNERQEIECGTRPWIPPCVQDRVMPPPPATEDVGDGS